MNAKGALTFRFIILGILAVVVLVVGIALINSGSGPAKIVKDTGTQAGETLKDATKGLDLGKKETPEKTETEKKLDEEDLKKLTEDLEKVEATVPKEDLKRVDNALSAIDVFDANPQQNENHIVKNSEDAIFVLDTTREDYKKVTSKPLDDKDAEPSTFIDILDDFRVAQLLKMAESFTDPRIIAKYPIESVKAYTLLFELSNYWKLKGQFIKEEEKSIVFKQGDIELTNSEYAQFLHQTIPTSTLFELSKIMLTQEVHKALPEIDHPNVVEGILTDLKNSEDSFSKFTTQRLKTQDETFSHASLNILLQLKNVEEPSLFDHAQGEYATIDPDPGLTLLKAIQEYEFICPVSNTKCRTNPAMQEAYLLIVKICTNVPLERYDNIHTDDEALESLYTVVESRCGPYLSQ